MGEHFPKNRKPGRTNMVETFIFTVVVAGLVFNVMNFFMIRRDKNKGCGLDCKCRYPDTNVRDILIDYELEKAKKLDTAIHKIEDEHEKN